MAGNDSSQVAQVEKHAIISVDGRPALSNEEAALDNDDERPTRRAAPFDPLDIHHHREASRRLNEARTQCPVSEPYPHTYFVAPMTDVEGVLLDGAHFSARSNFRIDPKNGAKFRKRINAIVSMDPPEHTDVRRRLRQWFTPRNLKLLEPRVRELVVDQINAFPVGERFDLAPVAKRLAGLVVYQLLGAPEEDWDQLEAWTEAVHRRLPAPVEDTREFNDQVAYVKHLIEALVAVGPTADESTVVAGMANAVVAGELPLSEATVHVFQLIQAGTDTTSVLIVNLLYQLLSDRRRWLLVQQEPDRLEQAVEESLRHDSPIQYVMRTPRQRTFIRDCPIEVDEQVVLGLQSANWDEGVWGPNAADFDLDREHKRAHVAFGKGAHACLGAPLARIEARVFVEELLRCHPEVEIDAGYRYELAPEPMMRRPSSLLLLIPRTPTP